MSGHFDRHEGGILRDTIFVASGGRRHGKAEFAATADRFNKITKVIFQVADWVVEEVVPEAAGEAMIEALEKSCELTDGIALAKLRKRVALLKELRPKRSVIRFGIDPGTSDSWAALLSLRGLADASQFAAFAKPRGAFDFHGTNEHGDRQSLLIDSLTRLSSHPPDIETFKIFYDKPDRREKDWKRKKPPEAKPVKAAGKLLMALVNRVAVIDKRLLSYPRSR